MVTAFKYTLNLFSALLKLLFSFINTKFCHLLLCYFLFKCVFSCVYCKNVLYDLLSK